MSVNSVHLVPDHGFCKCPQPSITLLKDLGVAGDAHCGRTVQHLHDRKNKPDKINLKQVHLFPLEQLRLPTFRGNDKQPVLPGQMGENVTTEGIDLYALSEGTRLYFIDIRRKKIFTLLKISPLSKMFSDATQHPSYNYWMAALIMFLALSIVSHHYILAGATFLPFLFGLGIAQSLAPCLLGPVVRVTGL